MSIHAEAISQGQIKALVGNRNCVYSEPRPVTAKAKSPVENRR